MIFTRKTARSMKVQYTDEDIIRGIDIVKGTEYTTDILTNYDHHEYFSIRDHYDCINSGVSKIMFKFKPAHVIQSIKDGIADSFIVTNTSTEKAIRYIDREYGEKIRQETLKKFNSTIFRYCIMRDSVFGRLIYNKNSCMFEYSMDVFSRKNTGCIGEEYWFYFADSAKDYLDDILYKVKFNNDNFNDVAIAALIDVDNTNDEFIINKNIVIGSIPIN